MIMNFLRNNQIAAGLLAVLRVYIGWSWLSAGWGKVTGDEPFSAAGFLNGAVANPVMSHGEVVYPTYVSFVESFVLPNAGLFSFMVAWGEVLVGLGLILGVLTTYAAFFALVMNFAFMFAGTVSSNPWMVLLTIFIVVAGANAGKFGGDRWVLPYLKGMLSKKGNAKNISAA